jgi:PKD repeat protein
LNPIHQYEVEGVYTVTLTVTDDDGGVDVDTLTITVIGKLQADAGGPYSSNEGYPITFDGSSSYDPGGVIVSYEWDLDDDGGYDDATGPEVEYTWWDDYNGVISLRVTNDRGETDSDSTAIDIINLVPVVDAGEDKNIETEENVSFSGSFKDPSNDVWIIAWDFGDGAAGSGTLNPTHQYEDGGVYTVTLTVTDDDGGIGSDILTVTVTGNRLIADAGNPYSGNEGYPITFDGTGSDDPRHHRKIVVYEWDFDGDGEYDDATGPEVEYTWEDDYSGTVSLRVTNDLGEMDSDSTTVDIINVAPVVDAGEDENVVVGEPIRFSGSFEDPGDDIWTVLWNFGDGETDTGTLNPIHQYEVEGVYTVTLTVTDDDGGVDVDTLTITVPLILLRPHLQNRLQFKLLVYALTSHL